MMILNLRELASSGGPMELTGSLNVADTEPGRSDVRIKQPVHVGLDARYETDVADVTGTLSTVLSLLCSKCLKTFEERAEYPVSEKFTLQQSAAERDEDIHLVTDEVIQLDRYLIDTLLVHLPMAPVCDSACKGLCPSCGCDLNIKSCDCKQDDTDPRLAALKDFFIKEKE